MSRIYPCVYCTDDLHCTKYTDDNYESWCVLGPCRDETPSNADRIRAMSDGELATLFEEYGDCPPRYCPHDGKGAKITRIDCMNCWLDWLRQEAEDGKQDQSAP